MKPCVCGHWHATTCWECGCNEYQADDGTDGVVDDSCAGHGTIFRAEHTPPGVNTVRVNLFNDEVTP